MNRRVWGDGLNQSTEAEYKNKADSEGVTTIDISDYLSLIGIIINVGILLGFFAYYWFVRIEIIASLSQLGFILSVLILISALIVALFAVCDYILRKNSPVGNHLTGVTYFSSIGGILLGVLCSVFVNLFP